MKLVVKESLKLISPILLTGTLAGCGDGGGDGGDDLNTQASAGTLVVSESSNVTTQRILGRSSIIGAQAYDCPDVPSGYAPLQSVTVEFLVDEQTVATTTTTDECGGFSASVPTTVTLVRAKSADNRDLIADIEVFGSSGGGIASTVPGDAEFQIASLQSTDTSLAFTVTDTLTNKAVIGIPQSAFSMTVNSTDVGIASVENAATTGEPASVALVLDASGSMSSVVYDQDDEPIVDANGYNYNRLRIVALASHAYLDNMPTTDESAFVIFDSDVNFIDDAAIADLFYMTDMNGAETTYSFSTDGFSNSSADLRFVVDAYNYFSDYYGHSPLDERHSESPEVNISGYPWGGSTAMYDAMIEALDRITNRTSQRKLVIAMSDGENNLGLNEETDVIASAQAKGIPIYTIAYGDADPETMENIAQETNATSFVVADADLTAVFQSIQTGITFQYIANLGEALVEGDVVNLTMDYNGLQVSREITH
jgi:Mg-chelatase subunit ChlD